MHEYEHIFQEISDYSKSLSAEATYYWEYHQVRYRWIVELVAKLLKEKGWGADEGPRLLDIGNSFVTMIIERAFPKVRVDTMGYLDSRYAPQRTSSHIHMDLNDLYYQEKWPVIDHDGYDIVLMLEVIEHLYVAPTLILKGLAHIIKPGGLIVIQTPNAVTLAKRYLMLAGNNPYEQIREDRFNPGHYREYTRRELIEIAGKCGLEPIQIHMLNYFPPSEGFAGTLDRLSAYLPEQFKTGMTGVFRKKG